MQDGNLYYLTIHVNAKKIWFYWVMSTMALPSLALADNTLSDELQTIKQTVLELSVKVALTQRAQKDIEQPATHVFLSCDDVSLTPLSVSIALEGRSTKETTFTELQRDAFRGGGWYLAQDVPDADLHHLQLKVVYRAVDTPLDERQLSLDTVIETGELNDALVVVLDSPTFGKPLLRAVTVHPYSKQLGFIDRLLDGKIESDHVANRYRVGGLNDPVVRLARFLESTQNYLAAVTLLSVAGREHERASNPEYAIALGRALLEYGLPSAAQALLPTGEASESPAAIDLRLALGNYYLQRGMFSSADVAVGTPPSRRDPVRLLAWQDVKSESLLAQGRMTDAAAVLRAMEPQSGFTGYQRYYNFGVAQARNGDLLAGLTILERIGSMISTDPLMIALIDHANMVVGLHFLKAGQGATAIPALERIHDQGPDASRAILDLGWAWLAPAGSKQTRATVGDERMVGIPPESAGIAGDKGDQNLYQRFDLNPFEQAKVEKSQDGKLRRALGIWVQLVDRPIPDDAVVEAKVAIASQLQEAGLYPQAAKYYEQSIAALVKSLDVVDDAERYVSGARADADIYDPAAEMPFDRELHHLPPPAMAYYLSDTMASSIFRNRLADYRDALELREEATKLVEFVRDRQNAACENSVVVRGNSEPCGRLTHALTELTDIQTQIIDVSSAMRRDLPTPLLLELAGRREWFTRLLRDCRFNLARSYDAAR